MPGAPPSLTVAGIPSVAVCWLIPRLAGFRALAPAVEVVFAESTPAPARMAVARFLPGRTVPVAAPHLGRPATPAAILAAGLLHDTDTTGWRAWLDAAGTRDLAVASGPVFEDFNPLRAAALAGQGVALCPLAIVAEDLREAGWRGFPRSRCATTTHITSSPPRRRPRTAPPSSRRSATGLSPPRRRPASPLPHPLRLV